MISIASILRTLCARVGLAPERIDVADLEDVFIIGFVVSNVMSLADAVEPLRKAGFFDVVDTPGLMRFVARGKGHVRSFTADDLGATDGTSTEWPAAVTTRLQQNVELPQQLRVHYRNFDRDYEVDEAPSPFRRSDDHNDIDLELALTLDTARAAQIAEVLWADMWASRWSHETTVDFQHLDLEPSDIVLLPVDDRQERVRIVAVADQAFMMRKLSMVRDDDGHYVAVATSELPHSTPAILAILQATELLVLELPPLAVTHSDAGFYLAVRPLPGGNTWRGVSVYRSADEGLTFDTPAILDVATAATTGTLDSALPEGDLPLGSPTYDDTSVLLLTLASGALESRPNEDLEQRGANTAAIGIHGRWEVLQFGVATQVSPTQWTARHLLRGRRGTEYVLGTSQAGDQFVLLTGGGVVHPTLTPAQLHAPMLYKAVSLGAAFLDGVDYPHAGEGRILLPFAPIHLYTTRNLEGDITIYWMRRDRLGWDLGGGSPDPNSDPPLTFEIDISLPGSPTRVLRTLTSHVESVVYTADQQAADLLGPPTWSADSTLVSADETDVTADAALVPGAPWSADSTDVTADRTDVTADALDRATSALRTATVYQISPIVGRGIPAAIDFLSGPQAFSVSETSGRLLWGGEVEMTTDTGTGGGGGGTAGPFALVWTLQAGADADDTFEALAVGNGLIVAVGANEASSPFSPAIETSPDGITWTVRTDPQAFHGYLSRVAFGGGRFIAGGRNTDAGTNSVIVSVDGITWTEHAIAGWTGEVYGLAYLPGSPGRWLMVPSYANFGAGSALYTSDDDGVTWTGRAATGYTNYNTSNFDQPAACFCDGTRFVLANVDTTGTAVYATSLDGVTWTNVTTPAGWDSANGGLLAGLFADTKYLLAGEYENTNGYVQAFSATALAPYTGGANHSADTGLTISRSIVGAAFGQGLFVVVSYWGDYADSDSTFASWITDFLPIGGAPRDITYDGTQFVVVGTGGAICTAPYP